MKLRRTEQINQIKKSKEPYDVLVIGGGASGLGVALDAISRGLSVLLLEKYDFGKGTSSRSTKLVHGGVRYLQQGNIQLVREALKERAFLLEKADHITRIQPFIIPFYTLFTGLYYYIGLKMYDLLAGSRRIGRTTWLKKSTVVKKIPNIKSQKLKGGIQYFDGQFDDSRLCIDLVTTIVQGGGNCINYCGVKSFLKSKSKITGVIAYDEINDQNLEIFAHSVVNATGVFTNKLIKLDDAQAKDIVIPSRGSHLVLKDSFIGGSSAMMIPKTSDGRVLFIIPWKGYAVVGTTDIKTSEAVYEPIVEKGEVDFMLNNAKKYLNQPPTLKDITSVFSGLRPLAAPKDNSTKTKEISRGHQIIWTDSNLCNIIGGKWTTFRKMGEDVLNEISRHLEWKLPASTSDNITIINTSENPGLDQLLPSDKELLRIIDEEMVMTLEDLMARRTRVLFLDIHLAKKLLDSWAELLRKQLNESDDWKTRQIEHVELYISTHFTPITH
jgi:glycerol-3-phosphate dehydrogenase